MVEKNHTGPYLPRFRYSCSARQNATVDFRMIVYHIIMMWYTCQLCDPCIGLLRIHDTADQVPIDSNGSTTVVAYPKIEFVSRPSRLLLIAHWPGVDFAAQNRRPVGAIKAKLGAIAGRQRALSLARRRLHAIAYHEDASSGRVKWWRRDRWVATHP